MRCLSAIRLGILVPVLLFNCLQLIAQQPAFPYQNPQLPVKERVDDLLSGMTLEEKAGQLMYEAPAIERLGVPEYNWWNEWLDGVARNGRATVFPQAIGLVSG